MKFKFIYIFLLILFILPIDSMAISSIDFARSKGHVIDDRYAPKGSIIVEAKTGTIIWEEDIHKKWTPASMSKLMTIALVFDEIKEGKISLDTDVFVDQKYVDIANMRQLSNNKMILGANYSVSELLDLVIVPSSAVATYMLADLVEKDRTLFIKKLNEKAISLGMKDTIYVNPIGVPNKLLGSLAVKGLPEDDNYTTAYDYALLCQYLVNTYPELLNHTYKSQITMKPGTKYQDVINGHNHSLLGARFPLEGADGIKTGSAGMGYNHSVTAKRGDMRLIEIILGVSKWGDKNAENMRHIIGNELLEDAFSKYEYKLILDKGEHNINGKKVKLSTPLYDLILKDVNYDFILNEKDKTISINYDRKILDNNNIPTVKYEVYNIKKNNKYNNINLNIFLFLGLFVFIILLTILIVFYKKNN